MRAQSYSPFRLLVLVVHFGVLFAYSDGGLVNASPNLDPTARIAPVSGVGKVRWGYHVPYHPSSRASLEAHIGDLDVVSPMWYRLEGDGSVVEAYKDDHAAITRIVRQ